MTNSITYLVISFLLLLRLSKGSLFDVIGRQHGRSTIKTVLSLIADEKKKVKCVEDLSFLTSCKAFGIFPKFLRFKLYKRTLHGSKLYRNFQSQLLDNEIKEKKHRITALQKCATEKREHLLATLTFFQYYWLSKEVRDSVSIYQKKTKEIHARKLCKIGIINKIEPCDPDKVIFNLSSKPLPPRIKTLLAFGLDFKLPIWKLNFYRYFLHFEKLVCSIAHLPLSSRYSFEDVKRRIRTVGNKYYHGFNASKIFSAVFSRNDVKSLKDFASDNTIIVTRPDKGKGVVILDRSEYVCKLTNLLSDRSKFVCIKEPIHKLLLKVEGKVNRLLSKLKESSCITENKYNDLYASGTNPGILYGLPKVHKAMVPLRPIFSACKTPTFKLAKYLVPILAPFTENEFTVKNSYQFADDMKNMRLESSMTMASFDIESLFTNIPVRETINICIESLMPKIL